MKKKIIFYTSVFLLLIALITWSILSFSISNGVRAGKLVKLSKKGVLLKTYEGTLDLGSGDKLTWEFSVHDDEIGEKLSKYSGQQVQLFYNEHIWKVFYATKYNVVNYKIELSKDPNERLCRLINLFRKDKILVERGRNLLEKYDQALLKEVRSCQQ